MESSFRLCSFVRNGYIDGWVEEGVLLIFDLYWLLIVGINFLLMIWWFCYFVLLNKYNEKFWYSMVWYIDMVFWMVLFWFFVFFFISKWGVYFVLIELFLMYRYVMWC